MQSEASKRRRFGQPDGNHRKRLPRLGTVIGQRRLREIRRNAVLIAEIKSVSEFEGSSLDLMRAVVRNEALPWELRLVAAARLAPYEHATIAARPVGADSINHHLAERLSAAIVRAGRAIDVDP